MGQGASASSPRGGGDEEAAQQNPHLLSDEHEEDAHRGEANPPAAVLPVQAVPQGDAVALEVAQPPPAPAAAEAAPDVYFGAGFLPEGFVPAPQDALLLGMRPELAALVSNGLLGRLPQIPAVQNAPAAQGLVHIYRESIQLDPIADQPGKYTLSLRVDALEDSIIQAYWRAVETVNGAQVVFAPPPSPQAPEWASIRVSEGRDQVVRFDAPLELSALPEEVLNWESPAAGPAPISIMMSTATPGTANVVDTELVTARVQKNAANDTYSARTQRVRVRFRGRFYVVYEIFGAVENGPSGSQAVTATAGGRECVICITDPRDTVVLPCRHMCLCVPCAEALRTQSNKCPLCRTPVKGLLRVPTQPATPSGGSKSAAKASNGGEELEEVQLLSRESRASVDV